MVELNAIVDHGDDNARTRRAHVPCLIGGNRLQEPHLRQLRVRWRRIGEVMMVEFGREDAAVRVEPR